MPAAMSAVEGEADFACQELSGPFVAMNRSLLPQKGIPLRAPSNPDGSCLTLLTPSCADFSIEHEKKHGPLGH